ncbi:glucosylceramidase [Termitidicoccus mucosus]|uniref:Glucosylceramidase n=1 Tax=Termitidicoccus mucosus TaxID=1184151 RepID=A0A178IIF7_9BACT|nr:glucosylceramidase [Opitutaceae bacterium TSB47]
MSTRATDCGVVDVVQTSRCSGDRLSTLQPVPLAPTGSVTDGAPALTVSVEAERQSIIGFGGAFTEAAAHALAQMGATRRDEALKAYFDPGSGLRYTLGRAHINSCDFALGNYAYDDVPGDFELRHFDISRDRRLLIPLIKDALALVPGGLRLLASPWSPPAWMKTNNEMNRGGWLRPECREAWALYFAKYISAYAAEGIPIWAVTVQNEPAVVQKWDSCIYSAEDERDFVKRFLGPELARQGLADVKILIWDYNKDRIFERASVVLADPGTARHVWGVGFHWYAGDHFDQLEKVRAAWPEKILLATEGCVEGAPALGAWAQGERYAHSIIGDLNHGAAGWLDWNLVLDREGGPNHVGNFCDAPIIADAATDTLHYQSSYYYIGHFSRHVRPGARRLESDAGQTGLETAAFRNPGGEIVVVVLNKTGEPRPFILRAGDRECAASIPPRSIQTLTLAAS